MKKFNLKKKLPIPMREILKSHRILSLILYGYLLSMILCISNPVILHRNDDLRFMKIIFSI